MSHGQALPGGFTGLTMPMVQMAMQLPGLVQGGGGGGGGGGLPPAKKPRMEIGAAESASAFDDAGEMSDDEDSARSGGKGGLKQNTAAKKFQHCEVEKRRRERMNRYMAELAQMIPACNAVPRRLDKLSILKMAVDHMKSLRGDPHSSSDYKPGFLTDDELKQLVVEAANGFMVIIDCAQARVLFVSDTIEDVLHEDSDQWMGSCFYDLVHPKDIQKVKEQLVCFDVEEALKASVRQNVSSSPLVMHSQSMNGLRRSFLCRVKRTKINSISAHSSTLSVGRDYQKSEDMLRLLHSSQQSSPYEYAVLHCTGFIRNLTSSERQALRVEESSCTACLVAIARLQQFGDTGPQAKMEASENEFVARVGSDGRFTYVDPRVAGVLGYLPQDLIGQVSYEYYHPEDIQKMVQLHHEAMKRRTPMPTVQYRFLSKAQKWVGLAMKAFSFVNPFSQNVEYVVCTNVVLRSGATAELNTGAPMSSVAPPCMLTDRAAAAGVGLPSQDVDKQERIEQYVRLTISHQVEKQLMSQEQGHVADDDDPLTALLSESGILESAVARPAPPPVLPSILAQPHPSSSAGHFNPSPSTPAPSYVHTGSGGAVLTSPAQTTIEENAVRAQQILNEYNRISAVPKHHKDYNYDFPSGLFSSEVDLEGSQHAYQNLVKDLDNPEAFPNLFNQVEADPLRPQHMLGDIGFDIFD